MFGHSERVTFGSADFSMTRIRKCGFRCTSHADTRTSCALDPMHCLVGLRLCSVALQLFSSPCVDRIASMPPATSKPESSASNSAQSHRYLGEKRCKCCTASSTDPNPVKAGAYSIQFATVPWFSNSQGSAACDC